MASPLVTERVLPRSLTCRQGDDRGGVQRPRNYEVTVEHLPREVQLAGAENSPQTEPITRTFRPS